MPVPFDLIPTFDNLLFETAQSIDEFSDSFEPRTRQLMKDLGFQANGVFLMPKEQALTLEN